MTANPPRLLPRSTERRNPVGVLGAVCAVTIASLFAGVAPASATTLAASIEAHLQAGATATCPAQTLSEPFLKWGDEGSYGLAPGGSFEGSTSEWALSGAAKLAAGSEPFGVTGSLGASSLSLPAKGSAQSPFVCLSSTEGAFRFFDRSEAAESTVAVEVLYRTSLGNIAVPVGRVLAKSSWEPSPKLATGAALATAIAGGTVEVALRFTATSGASRIDDVYIDPRLHH
jgi:hypothetical protein